MIRFVFKGTSTQELVIITADQVVIHLINIWSGGENDLAATRNDNNLNESLPQNYITYKARPRDKKNSIITVGLNMRRRTPVAEVRRDDEKIFGIGEVMGKHLSIGLFPFQR